MVYKLTIVLLFIVVILISGTLYYVADPSLPLFRSEDEVHVSQENSDENLIQDGIHVRTGLKEGDGLMLVVQNCTTCHSAKLITQNSASNEGWRSMIKWMQQTQNLWDLGENEEKIVTYLAKNYPSSKMGRRAPLANIEWYELD